MSKLNLPAGAVSHFNEPDLLDDLLDHWTSNDHVAERQMLVRRLQVGTDEHALGRLPLVPPVLCCRIIYVASRRWLGRWAAGVDARMSDKV